MYCNPKQTFSSESYRQSKVIPHGLWKSEKGRSLDLSLHKHHSHCGVTDEYESRKWTAVTA